MSMLLFVALGVALFGHSVYRAYDKKMHKRAQEMFEREWRGANQL